MNIEKAVLTIGVASTLFPIFAAILRGRARFVVASTVLSALSFALLYVSIVQLHDLGPMTIPVSWVYLAVGATLPMLLAGYLFSCGFGRDAPGDAFRDNRLPFALLSLAGVGFLIFLGNPNFVASYNWSVGQGTINLGFLGKAYVGYLLIGLILVGYNLERTYRIAPPQSRPGLRLPLLGCLALLVSLTFTLSTGLLYSALGVGKIVASALPLTFASFAIGYGYLKGSITDVAAPVSRNVVYSSFTAFAAGMFVFALGVAAQVAAVTNWSPGEILIVSNLLLAVLMVALYVFSNRFKRSIKRFIDRNFYVNRYDYRSQWSNLTESLDSATGPDGVLTTTCALLKDIFATNDITIAIRDEASGDIKPVLGVGTELESAPTLEAESPLFEKLLKERKTLLMDRKPDDFVFVPIYAENDVWLDTTASQLVAPLLGGDELVGTIGLGRSVKNPSFTFEDAALLGSMAAQVASVLRSMQLAQQLAQAHEMELISQWSSMILHDLKNHLQPLRLAASNLVEFKDNPETAGICAQDINRVTDKMDELVQRLSQLRQHRNLGIERLSLNTLVHTTLERLQISRRSDVELDIALNAESEVCADEQMLSRVVENLLTNAIEAMDGAGRLRLATRDSANNGQSRVILEVTDSGCGIPEEMKSKIFRPFSTTKKNGLGLGLYQSRSIVRAHGGRMLVSDGEGVGTTFQIELSAIGKSDDLSTAHLDRAKSAAMDSIGDPPEKSA